MVVLICSICEGMKVNGPHPYKLQKKEGEGESSGPREERKKEGFSWCVCTWSSHNQSTKPKSKLRF